MRDEADTTDSSAHEEPRPKTSSSESGEEIEEVRAQLLRVAADFDNYRKRIEREREEFTRLSNERLFLEMLPVLDNLELAVNHVDTAVSEEVRCFAEGFSMVLTQFMGVLTKFEVEGFGEEGERFDPSFHEAMAQATRSDLTPGSIANVVQRGYTISDRLLRPALVVVASPDSGAELPKEPPAPEAEREDDVTSASPQGDSVDGDEAEPVDTPAEGEEVDVAFDFDEEALPNEDEVPVEIDEEPDVTTSNEGETRPDRQIV